MGSDKFEKLTPVAHQVLHTNLVSARKALAVSTPILTRNFRVTILVPIVDVETAVIAKVPPSPLYSIVKATARYVV